MKLILRIALIVVAFGNANSLSDSDQKLVVDEHNKRRSNLALGNEPAKGGGNLPSAKNMYKLKYSTELEKLAQNWADNCQFQHSPKNSRTYIGENIYKISDQEMPSKVLRHASELFWNENIEIGVPKNDLRLTITLFNRHVGHFTQMAWADTTEIGCGVQWCPNEPMTFVVCNYNTTGNVLNQPIYEQGSPCQEDSDCTTYQGSTCSASEGLCEISGAGNRGGNSYEQQQGRQRQNSWGQQDRRQYNTGAQHQRQGPNSWGQQDRRQYNTGAQHQRQGQNSWGQQDRQQYNTGAQHQRQNSCAFFQKLFQQQSQRQSGRQRNQSGQNREWQRQQWNWGK